MFFEKGAAAYFDGHYSKAITQFMQGQRIAPNGLFLYNISLCHQKLGNFDDALIAGLAAEERGIANHRYLAQRHGCRRHALE